LTERRKIKLRARSHGEPSSRNYLRALDLILELGYHEIMDAGARPLVPRSEWLLDPDISFLNHGWRTFERALAIRGGLRRDHRIDAAIIAFALGTIIGAGYNEFDEYERLADVFRN
jgi:hypothetical protein